MLRRTVLYLVCLLALATSAGAAERAQAVRIVDAEGRSIAGATIEVRSLDGDVLERLRADDDGRADLRALAPQEYRLFVSAEGFGLLKVRIEVDHGATALELRLDSIRFTQELEVTTSLPGLPTETGLEGEELRQGSTDDLAESMRHTPALGAFRRGAINMDPTLRGLQETEVGVFVDGTRTFAAGPGRMDSGLSHVSLQAVERVRVVKGPYALAWGAGALSAIQVETYRPEFTSGGLENRRARRRRLHRQRRRRRCDGVVRRCHRAREVQYLRRIPRGRRLRGR